MQIGSRANIYDEGFEGNGYEALDVTNWSAAGDLNVTLIEFRSDSARSEWPLVPEQAITLLCPITIAELCAGLILAKPNSRRSR